MTDTYNPFTPRPGVSRLKIKRNTALENRIDHIVRLANKHRDCLERGDYWGMVELSYEYDRTKYMHRTAIMIRVEAAEMQKGKVNV